MEETVEPLVQVPVVPQPRYGARVVRMGDGTILVQQTIKRGPNQNDRYVIDDATGKREQFVNADENDAAVGRAVREALDGLLSA